VLYSVYLLSHSVLGIDPQSFWTEREYSVESSVSVPVGAIGDSPTAPTFRYRGFFINDEVLFFDELLLFF
jgi:hypothetical protein